MELFVHWHGHACFSLEYGGYTIVIDPYADDYVPGLSPLRLNAHEVLCSHGHRDHSASELVGLLPTRGSPFTVTRIPSYHDSEEGRLRGENIIHLLECDTLRIAHFGDLGCPLSASQMETIGRLDAAMIPVGGYYTIGPGEARELMDALSPKIVFPMHYRSNVFGFDVLKTVDDFLALTGGGRRYPGNHRSITEQSPSEISVLTYQG